MRQPTRGWPPSPCGLGDPPGWVAPPGGPPGPLRWSRDTPGDPRRSPDGRKLDFLYIILYLRTIPEPLVTSGISSGTPNNFRVSMCMYLYDPSVTEP